LRPLWRKERRAPGGIWEPSMLDLLTMDSKPKVKAEWT